MGGRIVVRVFSGLVIADILVGFLNRSIMDNDRKAPRMSDVKESRSAVGTNARSIWQSMEMTIAVDRWAEKKGIDPKIVPTKYIGRVIGDATYDS